MREVVTFAGSAERLVIRHEPAIQQHVDPLKEAECRRAGK